MHSLITCYVAIIYVSLTTISPSFCSLELSSPPVHYNILNTSNVTKGVSFFRTDQNCIFCLVVLNLKYLEIQSMLALHGLDLKFLI